MKNIIAVAASLVVNLSAIAVFAHSANDAVPVPNGEVIVTEVSIDAVPSLAQAAIAQIDAG